MKIELLFFGIVADLLETSSKTITIKKDSSVADLKDLLQNNYKQLNGLNSYAIAVNESYAEDNNILKENDIVAIIPPVSGG